MPSTPDAPLRAPSPLRLAIAGMLTLAVAIGIGRFAFTPLLPLMQKSLGLSLQLAGWLASANYVGYLAGALSAVWIRLSPATMVRVSLVAIAPLTAGMGLTADPFAWLVLRGLAGIASAWALVFASAWILRALSQRGSGHLAGVVFGGVGLGTALAGALCVVFLYWAWSSDQSWIALAVVALLLTAVVWPAYRSAQADALNADPVERPARSTGHSFEKVRLIVCYGCFGFGYIIPATFIAAMARQALPSGLMFGVAWPVFGTAALLSTLVAGRLSARISYRTLWIVAIFIMAAGVTLPVVWAGLVPILISALCVGGTFMVVTLAGMQEARRIAPENPSSLMAGMTAAFAAGQILGPALVSLLSGLPTGMHRSLVAAAVTLVLSGLALVRR